MLHDKHGGCIEITDFMPRFEQHGHIFRPMSLVHRVRLTAGSPRIRIRLRPACIYGAQRPTMTWATTISAMSCPIWRYG
jgi:hypothetical protein